MTVPLIADPTAFRNQYGPWAVIAGASDGTGEQFAHQIAATGINCVLVARRHSVLQTLAANLEKTHGIETRVVVLDLSLPAAGQQLCKAVADLEVGLLVSNAGADTAGKLFTEGDLDTWHRLIHMNIHNPMDAAHILAQGMIARGRGGLLLMGSGQAIGGQPRTGVYSACKGFSLNLCEAMWTELKPLGVDVLSVVAPLMHTPTLQRTLGDLVDKIPGVMHADEVVRTALEQLDTGPLYIFPTGIPGDDPEALMAARRGRIDNVLQLAKAMFEGG